VKVADPKRKREMAQFVGALCVLFLFTMVYLWQHFSAIEYGYRIEQAKASRDSVVEMNRALRLEQASLRDPERIDTLARGLGFQTPQAGQVQMMDTAIDTGAPVLASARISVVSAP
jgi:cell division protein FtsL